MARKHVVNKKFSGVKIIVAGETFRKCVRSNEVKKMRHFLLVLSNLITVPVHHPNIIAYININTFTGFYGLNFYSKGNKISQRQLKNGAKFNDSRVKICSTHFLCRRSPTTRSPIWATLLFLRIWGPSFDAIKYPVSPNTLYSLQRRVPIRACPNVALLFHYATCYLV